MLATCLILEHLLANNMLGSSLTTRWFMLTRRICSSAGHLNGTTRTKVTFALGNYKMLQTSYPSKFNIAKIFATPETLINTFVRTTSNLSVQEKKPLEDSNTSEIKNMSKLTATEQLSQLPPEEQKKLKMYQLEYDIDYSEGCKVPENVTDEMWLSLLHECPSKHSRSRRMSYWRGIEAQKLKRKKRKVENLEKDTQLKLEKQKLKDQGILPETWNTIFFKIYSTQMNRFYHSRMVHAMEFGQNLVVDMDFDNSMRPQEHQNLVDQLLMVYGANKLNPDPYHIRLCNAKPQSPSMMKWNRALEKTNSANILVSTHEECYTELFPNNKIVYLTPNAPNYVDEYDRDAVYIIGGFIDKAVTKPLTFAKAKRQGLKMAKLPIDKYLRWGTGNKNLTLDQVMNILLDIKTTGDWGKAMRHVPVRKVKTQEQLEEERAAKIKKSRQFRGLKY